ncbi:PREDICTED: uncharacterized protein LOC106328223 isoform X1 [Brassica oleracea var. oleracea]|uniref:uncharacterized protein LOC106328223 isoform X1 n=2 Tax=Brassica oleracea var. oleracea TaxID=109376 RepID=UPI0006A6B859|nr:PREDICTED: uncharacterized protein LOC106328223 isoform X1 [Brassica oleracea var. oleracea]
MMVAKSFDLWQKDVFFSAAEEVQQSADTMESAYRLWIKEKRESGRVSVESDHLCNELQAALSTAKWQLEEFERAVRLSHGRCRDDTTLTRHKQFVSAIENQIHRVQSALSENGEQPLRWVDLNKEERDDLAMFLSGSSQTSESFSSESINLSRCYGDCVIDIDDERGSPESAGNRNGTRRTWSSPNVPDISALRINVPLEEEENKRYVSQTEATPKEKGYKPLFWMQRFRDYNQLFDRVRYYQRRFGVPLTRPVRIPFNRPVQLILSLALLLSLLCEFIFSLGFGSHIVSSESFKFSVFVSSLAVLFRVY